MRIVFFGTPRFAVPSLSALLGAGFDVPLVVTQPDRPVGRSGRPQPSPVASLAEERGIPVEKPARVRGNAAFLETLRGARPDVIVVVAYGRILPDEILDLPPQGLRQRSRLAPPAPPRRVARSGGDSRGRQRDRRRNDEDRVGARRGAGLSRAQGRHRRPRGRGRALRPSRSARARELLVETIRGLESGALEPHPQAGEPTFSRPLTREDARVDWSRPAAEIERRLRAFTPWPGLYGILAGERVKLIEIEPAAPAERESEPGTVRAEDGWPVVAAGQGSALVLRKVQRAGRKPVTGREFLDGLPNLPARFEPA